MSLYLDTSLIVSALTNEGASKRARAWLAAHGTEALTISDWVVTEVSSAVSLKVRTGELDAGGRAAVLAAFARLCAGGLAVLPVTPSQFRLAARFAEQFSLGLRAGDALHLAISAERGAALYTLDRRLAQAGPVLGIETHLV